MFVLDVLDHKAQGLKDLLAGHTRPDVLLVVLALLLNFLFQFGLQFLLQLLSRRFLRGVLADSHPLLVDVDHLLMPVRHIDRFILGGQPEVDAATLGRQHAFVIVFGCTVVTVGVHFT